MTDYKPECFGSVILHSPEHGFCQQCPLQDACATKVAENRGHIEKSLNQPIYDDGAAFWKAAQRRSMQRRTYAAKLSTYAPVETEKPAAKPKPAPAAPVKPSPPPSTPVPSGPALSPVEASKLPGLRKKVLSTLEGWAVKAIVPSQVLAGENPFDNVPGVRIAHLIIEVALLNDLALVKRDLCDAIERTLIEREGKAWSMGTIQSNVNIVAGAFAACNIAICKEKT